VNKSITALYPFIH